MAVSRGKGGPKGEGERSERAARNLAKPICGGVPRPYWAGARKEIGIPPWPALASAERVSLPEAAAYARYATAPGVDNVFTYAFATGTEMRSAFLISPSALPLRRTDGIMLL